MNNNIIRDMIHLKMEIIEEVSQHLPPAAKEKIDRLEYGFMAAMNEVSKEYLEKTEKTAEKENAAVIKVTVE